MNSPPLSLEPAPHPASPVSSFWKRNVVTWVSAVAGTALSALPIGGVVVLSHVLATPVSAGEFNPVLDPGDPAPAWKALPGVDGKPHALADLQAAPAVVVVFTCNSCPYAVDVEDRLIALAKANAERKVAVVAINVNKTPEDSLEKMRQRATDKGFPFPYLYDASQQIARDFGAIRTPEWFVLDGQRRVVYMGSLDDSPSGKDVTKPYVQAAINAVLAGKQPAIAETAPIGCNIRYRRARR